MILGYTRVSSKNQEREGYGLEVQRQEILSKYPDARIFSEAYTGATVDRPVFNQLMADIGKGDTLVVCKLDRLARNTVEGIQIVREIFKRQASVHVLNVGLLEDTPMGQFFLTILLAVAEMERTTILERTAAGKAQAIAEAEARGEKFVQGRPRKWNEEELDEAVNLLEAGSFTEVSRLTGIPRSTLARAKKERI